MKVYLGISLVLVSLLLAALTYINVVIKKRFTMSGGGINLITFASILLLTGIYLMKED